MMASGYTILGCRVGIGFLPPDETTPPGTKAGCHGHLQSNDKDGFCDYKSYNEFTLRSLFGIQFWRQNLEYIVRKNLDFYCTKEGIENILWDIQTDLRNRGLSTTPWISEQTSSSLQTMRDRFNAIFPVNMWAFKKILSPSGFVDVPYQIQRPNYAAFVSALNAILGRTATSQERSSIPESMYSVIEDVPRWSKANFWNRPIPPEWGQGAWWEQPPSVGGGLLTFFTVLETGEVVPGPWMSRMLDIFVPSWKTKTSTSTKMIVPSAKAITTVIGKVARRMSASSATSTSKSSSSIKSSSDNDAPGSGNSILIISVLAVSAVAAYVVYRKKM